MAKGQEKSQFSQLFLFPLSSSPASMELVPVVASILFAGPRLAKRSVKINSAFGSWGKLSRIMRLLDKI